MAVRAANSVMMMPASIVLPSPTSSAMNIRPYGDRRSFSTGLN